MAGEVSFIELGVEDAERGRVFYEGLFGWRMEAGTGGAGWAFPAGPGIGGGLHPGDAGASPYVFFRVDDMDAALARVRELRGTVEDVDVEGDEGQQTRFGRFRLCADDQGSRFGLHQPPR